MDDTLLMQIFVGNNCENMCMYQWFSKFISIAKCWSPWPIPSIKNRNENRSFVKGQFDDKLSRPFFHSRRECARARTAKRKSRWGDDDERLLILNAKQIELRKIQFTRRASSLGGQWATTTSRTVMGNCVSITVLAPAEPICLPFAFFGHFAPFDVNLHLPEWTIFKITELGDR